MQMKTTTLFFLDFFFLQPKDAAPKRNTVVQNHALKENILNSLNGVIIFNININHPLCFLDPSVNKSLKSA